MNKIHNRYREIPDRRNREGFSLLEIMIVVALIGMLATLAMPAFLKVRKQSQGKRIVNDARVIDAAIDAWAMENNKADGDDVDTAGIGSYAKTGTLNLTDVLGNPYGVGPVGTGQVRVATDTKSALAGVAIDWGAY
jgi:prepilin-type N-terminal cleavage/methylation domain-containing protein